MKEFSIKALAQIIKAEPTRNINDSLTGVSTDSRTIRAGDCFFAIAGEKFDGCQLCVVEIEGRDKFALSCNTIAEEGMLVSTDTTELSKARKKRLIDILTDHPHACLTCPQKDSNIAYPEILSEGILQIGVPITDPLVAFVILIVTAIVLLMVGGMLLAFAFLIDKKAIMIDKLLAQAIDDTVPSLRDISKKDRFYQLERLGELRDKGILSEKEFLMEKTKILEE